jgi:hypothetical protein
MKRFFYVLVSSNVRKNHQETPLGDVGKLIAEYYGNYQRGNISVDSKIIRLKVNDIAFINNTPPGAKHWVSLWV